MENAEFQISEGTDAIIVAGTTGETAMPDDEQVAVIDFAYYWKVT